MKMSFLHVCAAAGQPWAVAIVKQRMAELQDKLEADDA